MSNNFKKKKKNCDIKMLLPFDKCQTLISVIVLSAWQQIQTPRVLGASRVLPSAVSPVIWDLVGYQRKMSTCTCLSVRITSGKLRFILDTSHLCVCNSNLQLFTFTLHESSTFIYSLFVALADTFELMVTVGYE